LELDETPLYNWDKCTNGDFKYIQREPKYMLAEDFKYYEMLFNKYLDRYGLGDDFDKYLRLCEKYTKLYLKYRKTQDDFLKNQIRIVQGEIDQVDPSKINGMSIDESLIHLSKHMGYRVDKRTITVVEYKEMIKTYGGGN